MSPHSTSPTLESRLHSVGTALADSLAQILGALPGAPHRPNRLAALLGVNRAVASRILSATAKDNPIEVLHLVPGPEPLRKITTHLAAHDAFANLSHLLDSTTAAINAFDSLIAEEAGTRPALDALISPHLAGAREKLELASRYSIYRGLSQLRGVQGDLWIAAAIIAPAKDDSQKLDLTWLNGTAAMRRLRPGAPVHFSYRFPDQSPGDSGNEQTPGLMATTSLEQFCTNPPAALEARQVGEEIHYALPDKILGPKDSRDMFVVDHHPASMLRYAVPNANQLTSLFVEPAIPVAQLVFDVILHEDAFPGAAPHLFFYDTGCNGIANVNDRTRDIERVDQVAPLEMLQGNLTEYATTELPAYAPMLKHLAKRFGWDTSKFRGYRLSMQYPVFGWQTCMAFQKPEHE